MNDRTPGACAPPPTSADHAAHEPDPATWPGLVYRLTRNWRAVARLLFILTALVGSVLTIALVLDITALTLFGFGLERAP